jgi:hypothetical protein
MTPTSPCPRKLPDECACDRTLDVYLCAERRAQQLGYELDRLTEQYVRAVDEMRAAGEVAYGARLHCRIERQRKIGTRLEQIQRRLHALANKTKGVSQ